MKKVLTLVLTLAMILSCMTMFACSKDESKKPADDTTPTEPTSTEPTSTEPTTPTQPTEPEPVPPTIKTTTLTAGTVDESYTKKFSASGDRPYTWTITAGALPDGLTMENGTISGTPTKDGDFTFTVCVTNEAGKEEKEFTLKIKPAPIKPTNNIVIGTPVIDGVRDELYAGCSELILTKEITTNFTAEEKAIGAGWAGDNTLADAVDTYITFRFVVDNEYLYICEERGDVTQNYTATTFRQPYAGDGSLIWFTKNNTLQFGLQWNKATQESKDPQIGLFQNDDQGTSELKSWECVAQYDDTGYYYVMEAKIPLADIGLTYENFTEGKVGATFCTVDITAEEFDGDTAKLWTGIGYQMQYPGVNNWADCYRLVVPKA